MRVIKKSAKIIGIILLLLVLALFIAPFFLKEKIQAFVETQINEQLEAEVKFKDFGLSFFSSFPDANISLHDFSVVGKESFAQDTLIRGKELSVSTGIFSTLSGNSLKINKVKLDGARIFVHILEDGKANYDISKPTEENTAETTSSDFNLSLSNYTLSNSDIIYQDESIPVKLSLLNFQHTGKGDFTLSDFVLDTESQAEKFNLIYDGVSYIKEGKLEALAKLKISLEPNIKVEFLENNFLLNELALRLDGFMALPNEEDIVMELTYGAEKTSFASLLSLIPGMYKEGFDDIHTEGKIGFSGSVSGTYNEQRLPGFSLDLDIDNGLFKYPDLPKPVSGVELDLKIDNPDGDLENTHIEIKELHADLGDNPIDGKAVIDGFENMSLDGFLNAEINLAELIQVYPIEGTNLAGSFSLDAQAQGTYNEAKGLFPQVNASMSLEEGYVKNTEYNTELKNLGFHARMQDPDGSMKRASLDVPDFHFELGGEPLDGSLHVENFDSPIYKLTANGRLDLAQLMEIYPIDSMSLAGKLIVEAFSTEGNYADIEAENYANLPTSGIVNIENLRYSDREYVQHGFTIDKGKATFTPSRLEISNAKGNLGSSDYVASGYFSNYWAYALMENQPLKGEMTLISKNFNTNEWMMEEESTTAGGEGSSEAPLEVVAVPPELDIYFKADIAKLQYDDININDFKGTVHVADQAVALQDIDFAMLGGKVGMSGLYNTIDLKNPTYNFYLNLDQLNIQEAFKHLSMVQAFAPVAEFVEGLANMEVGISGRLKEDMSPVLENVTGLGLMEIVEGRLTKSNLISKVQEKTKINSLNAGKIDLRNIIAQFEIKDGFIEMKPFDFKVKDILFTLGGKQNITGALDYNLDIDAPSGSLGNAAFSALSGLSGGALKTSERVQVNLNIGGTMQDPLVSGGKGGSVDQLKDQATDLVVDKLTDKLGVDDGDVVLDKDSLKKKTDELAQQAKDSARQVVENAKKQAKDSLDNAVAKAKEDAQKKAEEELKKAVGDDAAEALEKLKNKVKLPFGKKKKKKEEGGN